MHSSAGKSIIQSLESYQSHMSRILVGQCDTESLDRIRYHVGVLHGIGQVLSILAQAKMDASVIADPREPKSFNQPPATWCAT